MSKNVDVVVVGGGIGALCSAILLGAQGLVVELHEGSDRLGGKAAEIEVDGVRVDTGPSVLTLPEVFDPVFAAAGQKRTEELPLHRPHPSFRYLFPAGPALDVFHEIEETLDSVRHQLGQRAADELERYLARAAGIWTAAEPHFVMAQAPNVTSLLFGGIRAWNAATRIDAFSKMGAVIDSTVSDPHLRMILKRYATYNGSDVRQAPGTLGCIAHVELTLGGFGVVGGMYRLVSALERAALKVGVAIHTSSTIEKILVKGRRIIGVEARAGMIACSQVIYGGETSLLAQGLISGHRLPTYKGQPSMSAHTAIYRATHTPARVAAHTVIFPQDYEQEFAHIFDWGRPPADPTVYLCDQSLCHLRTAWTGQSPVFAMLNAPAVSDSYAGELEPQLQTQLYDKLVSHGLIGSTDRCLWWRTPHELKTRFIGSNGALYGLSSNDKQAAFRRPANKTSISGLYLASGSAHPGGGVPMVAQSGKLAASLALADRQKQVRSA